jgi:hypothetical protein
MSKKKAAYSEGTAEGDMMDHSNELTPELVPVPEKVSVKPKIENPVAVPEPKPEPVIEPTPAIVALPVFLKISGMRKDQLGGFSLFARKQKLGPMSVSEWRLEMTKFRARPVR